MPPKRKAKGRKGGRKAEVLKIDGDWKDAIRWAMAPANANEPKLGAGGEIVEYDETYVGGRPRGHARYSQQVCLTDHGPRTKTAGLRKEGGK